MYLQRAIYQDLLKWKKADSGKVLEVNGARQSGKTYILTKFAKENYRQFIYINMVQSSGRQFEACLNQISSQWRPGEKREEKPIHQALRLYENTFRDQKDTVVVIDEIQDSPQVFSLIREFAREFQAHFIVTGSYLGKTVNREYFLPAGDMDVMILDTMAGMINENFVYTVLRKKAEQHEIAGTAPWYALYQGGEMDFFVNSRSDYCNYGIEVKAGRGAAKTADRMLRDGKIQYLYLLKGDTCGGIEDKKITVPVYLAGRIEFERGR